MHQDGELWRLMDRRSRENLPFWVLLRLYLDPFALACPVPHGRNPIARAAALRHNRALRPFLPVYAMRWLALHALSWGGILIAGAPWPQTLHVALASVSGVGILCTAGVITFVAAAWWMLGADTA